MKGKERLATQHPHLQCLIPFSGCCIAITRTTCSLWTSTPQKPFPFIPICPCLAHQFPHQVPSIGQEWFLLIFKNSIQEVLVGITCLLICICLFPLLDSFLCWGITSGAKSPFPVQSVCPRAHVWQRAAFYSSHTQTYHLPFHLYIGSF